jgi:hypothetical protein
LSACAAASLSAIFALSMIAIFKSDFRQSNIRFCGSSSESQYFWVVDGSR